MIERECTGCRTKRPATLEHFGPNKDCQHGLNPVCRPCRRKYLREWKAANAERVLPRRRQLYMERHSETEKAKQRARLLATPLRIRARILRQGMADRAKRRDIPFDSEFFSVAYLMEWIQRTPNCPCCGCGIDYGYKGKGPNANSPSIDRFAPALGYIASNVALICWRCNNLKRDATADELEAIAKWMRSHL